MMLSVSINLQTFFTFCVIVFSFYLSILLNEVISTYSLFDITSSSLFNVPVLSSSNSGHCLLCSQLKLSSAVCSSLLSASVPSTLHVVIFTFFLSIFACLSCTSSFNTFLFITSNSISVNQPFLLIALA